MIRFDWPLGDACGLLQDSVQLQALAVQQPPQGNVSQLTYDPERLVPVEEHGEFPLSLPRADPDRLRHQTGGDPLQPCHLRPGNHKLDCGRKQTDNSWLHVTVSIRHVKQLLVISQALEKLLSSQAFQSHLSNTHIMSGDWACLTLVKVLLLRRLMVTNEQKKNILSNIKKFTLTV